MDANTGSEKINHGRRRFFGAAAMTIAAAEFGSFARAGASPAGAPPTPPRAAAGDDAIRPFHVSFPDSDVVDLRRRVAATRWPERELVPDATQGVQLATVQKLAAYWQKDYDWRKV